MTNFEYEAHAMTEKGNYLNLLNLAVKNSWNQIMSNYFGRVYATWNHSETAFGHRKVFESLEAVASEAEEQKESGRDFHNDSDCRKATELKRNSTGCPNSKCDTLKG